MIDDAPFPSLHYCVLVRGRLDPVWISRLYDPHIHCGRSPGGELQTELTGDVPDQAALLGLLTLLHDLGLTIRSVGVETTGQ